MSKVFYIGQERIKDVQEKEAGTYVITVPKTKAGQWIRIRVEDKNNLNKIHKTKLKTK